MRGRFIHQAMLAMFLTCQFSVCLAVDKPDANERIKYIDTVQKDFEAVRAQVEVSGDIKSNVVVGFATSMEKVLPRVGIPLLKVKSLVELKLARNEKESFQVIILPRHEDIEQVWVRVSDLRSKDGKRFAARNIQAVPIGYVETKAVPPYGSPHVGWWPDPILDFMQAVDIKKDDAQSFWVRVRAPKSQAPGVYKGKLEIMLGEDTAFSFDFYVRVYGFALPDTSPLPLAVTFWPHDYWLQETKELQARWRESEDYPINAWKKHKWKWADFLADYYLTYDSLYSYKDWTPDFEIIERLHTEERLGLFNLGYYSPCGKSSEQIKKWKADVLGRIRPAYEEAKQLDVLDHAYIYGCDDTRPELFPSMQRAAEILKTEFPDVILMSSSYDQHYGMGIKSMDAFCPYTSQFDQTRAAQARTLGTQVWWCICLHPHHPYCNMFIEYPAIEGRLLMGSMTAKYQPDGFLYYQISIWNSQKPINTGPFTDWDPRSWDTYHGDGSWTCVGPDGTPLPTIRLENFRDGLEDYAYYLILKAAVETVENSPKLRAQHTEWLAKAKKLLVVPKEVVKSLAEFTDDPAVVYHYRNSLAEAIEAAGIEPKVNYNRKYQPLHEAKDVDVSNIHMAVCIGDLDRVKSLIRNGADVNMTDSSGRTPLYLAIFTSHRDITEFLIAKGADLEVKDHKGETLLYQVCYNVLESEAELLISRGADVNVKTKYGNTPLHGAASAGHQELVELLVAKGADVNAKNKNNGTPLHMAVSRGHKDVAAILMAAGADVNLKRRRYPAGYTPLHSAAKGGHKDIVELLIIKGANFNVKDRQGQTPLDIAVRQNHKEIVELLREYGAR